MKIGIDDMKTISSIQKKFTEEFPYLKIEFFSKEHEVGAPSSKKSMKESSKKIGELRNKHINGTLSISPTMTVSDLEQNFQDQFGLAVQVFRRSGNAWLETTVTDSWTLDKQNKQGEALSIYLEGKGKDGEYEADE